MKDELGKTLSTDLLALYERGLRAANIRREQLLERELALLVEELLNAEEGVRIIAHELGVALLRGRIPPNGRGPVSPIGQIAGTHEVAYRFDGEFWTDELDQYVIAADDRCIDR